MTSDAPELVWLTDDHDQPRTYWAVETQPWKDVESTEYIRADLVPQWQQIETAPKDGTGMIAGWFDQFGDFHYAVTYWGEGDWIVARTVMCCYPDYWMPLPPPPTT